MDLNPVMSEPRQMFTYQRRLRFWQLVRFWFGLILATFSFVVMAAIWIELTHAQPLIWDPYSPFILLSIFLAGVSLVISSVVEDFKDSRRCSRFWR